jgi:hypothetical protein
MIDMRKTWTRRGLMQASLTVGTTALVAAPRIARPAEAPQRTIIIMCDGLVAPVIENDGNF